MLEITIYTDGSCLGNPGPGGYAAIIKYPSKIQKIVKGGVAYTTNNKMELAAIINGLSELSESCRVRLFSDSQYCVKGIREWLPNWIKNNWKNSKKQIVKNVELWQELNTLLQKHDVHAFHIPAHTGNVLNEKVDTLAREEAEKFIEREKDD